MPSACTRFDSAREWHWAQMCNRFAGMLIAGFLDPPMPRGVL
ncbi:hypothetical protein [Prescottella equi]|nr:hypothetical protein [Prescottella equi]